MSAVKLTPGLALYRAATAALSPLAPLLLQRRRARGKEDPQRWRERLGRAGAARPAGPLVWIHAASVGESLSVLPMIRRLRDQQFAVLVTTGTVTSAALLAERLPAGALHQFAPVDTPGAVRAFLDTWRPDAAFIVESEIWPNLIVETAARGVPLALINARMSDESLSGWRRAGGAAARLLGAFTLCLAQDEATAARLQALGARDVRTPGNLKLAADPLPADAAALAALRAAFGSRPRWLAASTHPGEETAAADAHAAMAARHPGLLTVIVPRHPDRGADIAASLRGRGLQVARRGAGETMTPETQVYVADTLGELGLFYRLCPVAFVGGSLIPHGGQNLLEPARLGCAVLHGPHVFNFAAIAAVLDDAGAQTVQDSAALAQAASALLADPAMAQRRGAALSTAAERETGALDRTLAALAPLLEPLRARA